MQTHHHHHQEHEHRHIDEDMLSVEEAYRQIMACFGPLEPEEKPLLECLGQTLAAEIRSPLALPPLANSGMDGYAVRRADIGGAGEAQPRRLQVIGLVAAGQVSAQTVAPGTAIRIMTGAPVPAGADTVVPFEETDEVERRAAGRTLDEIDIRADLPPRLQRAPRRRGRAAGSTGAGGRHGNPPGGNRRAGLPRPGTGAGHPPPPGFRPFHRRRTGIPGQSLGRGQNLRQQRLQRGRFHHRRRRPAPNPGIARDNLADMRRKLEQVAGSDLLVTSAGVSKGDYDVVKDVLTERGDINFWSVRMRPAKPLAFGMLRDDAGAAGATGTAGKPIPLMGLPGNPVSAMVAFEMFARPAIRAMLGRQRLARPVVEGTLTGPIRNTDGRRVFARVEVERQNGVFYANPTGPQGSNILTSMSRANGWPSARRDLPVKEAGERVSIIMLDWNEEVDL